MDGPGCPENRFHAILRKLEVPLDRLRQMFQAPIVPGLLQGEIQILGEPPQSMEESESCSALERQRRESSGVLQRPQDAPLTVPDGLA